MHTRALQVAKIIMGNDTEFDFDMLLSKVCIFYLFQYNRYNNLNFSRPFRRVVNFSFILNAKIIFYILSFAGTTYFDAHAMASR